MKMREQMNSSKAESSDYYTIRDTNYSRSQASR